MRAHAPSGFELESNLENLHEMYARSSVHDNQNDEGGSDSEFVNESEYFDRDLDDIIKKMKNEEES